MATSDTNELKNDALYRARFDRWRRTSSANLLPLAGELSESERSMEPRMFAESLRATLASRNAFRGVDLVRPNAAPALADGGADNTPALDPVTLALQTAQQHNTLPPPLPPVKETINQEERQERMRRVREWQLRAERKALEEDEDLGI